jgi:apolipoprotein N-acyltransferase
MKIEKVREIGHLVAGILVLKQGFVGLDTGNYKAAILYLGLGLLFMVFAGMQKTMNANFYHADTSFFFLESFTIFYTGWMDKSKDTMGFYYFMLVAAAIFFIAGLLSFYFSKGKKKRSGRKRRRRSRSVTSLDGISLEDKYPSTRRSKDEPY